MLKKRWKSQKLYIPAKTEVNYKSIGYVEKSQILEVKQ